MTWLLIGAVLWIAYRQSQLSDAYAHLVRLVRVNMDGELPEPNAYESSAITGEVFRQGLLITGLGWIYSACVGCAAAYRWWRAKR